MSRDQLIRRALWAAAVFNLAGAGLFTWPGSRVGQLAGLPADAPAVYRGLVCLFVLLFGASYAWLARQTSISRPLLCLGAIGKAGAFVLVCALWLAHAAPLRSVALISGDLAFAAIFAWWLLTSTSTPTGSQPRS